jgi:hypothetical protein
VPGAKAREGRLIGTWINRNVESCGGQPEPIMFQVTIRELFWLSTVAALAIGWIIHARSERADDQFLQIQLMEQRLHEASNLVAQLQLVLRNQSPEAAQQTEQDPR